MPYYEIQYSSISVILKDFIMWKHSSVHCAAHKFKLYHPPNIKILPHFVVKTWTYPHTPNSKLFSQTYRDNENYDSHHLACKVLDFYGPNDPS